MDYDQRTEDTSLHQLEQGNGTGAFISADEMHNKKTVINKKDDAFKNTYVPDSTPNVKSSAFTTKKLSPLIDTRPVPYSNVEETEWWVHDITSRVTAVVTAQAMMKRRSALNRPYASEPTSVPASTRSSPILFAADFPRTAVKLPAVTEAQTHLARLKEEALTKVIEHEGLARTLSVTTTAEGVSLQIGKCTILEFPQCPRLVRLARLCLTFCTCTKELIANFTSVKGSFDSTTSSPDITARLVK